LLSIWVKKGITYVPEVNILHLVHSVSVDSQLETSSKGCDFAGDDSCMVLLESGLGFVLKGCKLNSCLEPLVA
jgi:hypothetical protein